MRNLKKIDYKFLKNYIIYYIIKMDLIKKMTLLPNEIEDIIWNIYWKDIFTHRIINNIKSSIQSYNFIRDNCINLTYLNTENLTEKKSNILNYNKALQYLYKNTGINLLLRINDKFFNSFSKFYISPCFNDKEIGSFYNFTCMKSGYMRYHVLSDYRKILKK